MCVYVYVCVCVCVCVCVYIVDSIDEIGRIGFKVREGLGRV